MLSMSSKKYYNSKRRYNLLLSVLINIAFIIIFLYSFEPIHESNDDLAISFLVEGAWGERSAYLVYQNILWGKLLVRLYTLVPYVKWYNILLYLALFFAFISVTYVLICKQGKKAGIVSSIILVLFGGYYTYVVFQYTRIAAMLTCSGIILMCYALDDATLIYEKRSCIFCGVLLAVWGSMIRFQMFAVAVVLAAGSIVVKKIFNMFRLRKSSGLKRMWLYIVPFIMLGMISGTCYIVDRMCYKTDDKWCQYYEFNQVRTELWDYGFPEYNMNQEVYESVGISQNDYNFYLTWNMDEEKMSLGNLHMLSEIKPDKVFNAIGFFSVFPRYFISISIFVLYCIVSLFGLYTDKNSLYYILYEFICIMLFEAYFYYAGRYGIARVDYGIWLVALVTLLYGISPSLKEINKFNWKICTMIVGLALILLVEEQSRIIVATDGVIGSTKKIYEKVREDKEHLYIALVDVPRVYYAFDFWEPCKVGDLSNVYNAYGWEFNTTTRKQVLDEYNVSNIYRDSINNDKIYFMTDFSKREMLETYIKENYDDNIMLIYEKEIEGVDVWSVRTM